MARRSEPLARVCVPRAKTDGVNFHPRREEIHAVFLSGPLLAAGSSRATRFQNHCAV